MPVTAHRNVDLSLFYPLNPMPLIRVSGIAAFAAMRLPYCSGCTEHVPIGRVWPAYRLGVPVQLRRRCSANSFLEVEMNLTKIADFAQWMFPRAGVKEAVVSLVIAALGLSGGVVTIGLILFAR